MFISSQAKTSKVVSVVYPLTLPPNVYLQYLQVKHKSPMLPNDVFTTIVESQSSPVIAGYGQPLMTSQDLQCNICGNIGHIAVI